MSLHIIPSLVLQIVLEMTNWGLKYIVNLTGLIAKMEAIIMT